MIFVGNSPFCIKKGVLEWYGYLSSLPTRTIEVVLPSDTTRSVLPALGLAITRNAAEYSCSSLHEWGGQAAENVEKRQLSFQHTTGTGKPPPG
jgi:hypothetical protein